ncbi:MAG: hypothetical protein GX020_01180 [Firmicutes bacterium]|nr:hypothetical protein [Bacillota bacterium]
MKKLGIWVLVVTMVMGMVGIVPVSANVKDVPPDHWAYQAVVSLVNKGYLTVFEDGSFQGTKAVDRYTLAITIARILDEIEAGRVRSSIDDLELLQELTIEFREELVQWYAQKDAVEEQLANTQVMLQITEDRVSRVVASQTDLQEEVEKIKADIYNEIKKQNETIEQHAISLAEQIEAIATLKESLSDVENALIALESILLEQGVSLSELENWASEKAAVFVAMQADDSTLRKDLDELKQQLKTLEESLDSLVDLVGRTDGQFVKDIEKLTGQINSITTRNQEMEKDMQNLAIRITREGQNREALASEINKRLDSLEQQVGLSEDELALLTKTVTDEIYAQLNANLLREQRLERQLKTLEEDFASYKTNMEKEIKSAKSTTYIAIGVAAISVLLGYVK